MTSEPGPMTPYQKLCEGFLLEMMQNYNSETLSQPAFKVTAKSLIRFYPEFNMDNENPYKVFDLYRKHFRFTKRGWDQYQKEPGKVAYEHIQPIEGTYNELLRAKAASAVSIETVHEIMKKTEIVILSEDEATLLNGVSSNTYNFNGQKRKGLDLRETGTAAERLAAIRAQIEPLTEGNSILTKPE
jgi:hypothetical protein